MRTLTLILLMWSFLAFQVAWAEEEIAVTSTEENQRDKRDSKFIEVDFPALYKEYKQNKAKMTDFAFKTWWESVNVRLEGTYVKGTAIVKNAKKWLDWVVCRNGYRK
jgi:uncharacterized membrane protein